jgi:hypothetical protein
MITPRKGRIRTADIEIVEEPVTPGAKGRLVVSPDGKKVYFDTGSQLIELGRAQEAISSLSPSQVSPGSEDTEWKGSLSSLSDALSRIRNMIVRLTGRSWGTVDKAVPEYFSGTSGHTHSGVDGQGPQIPWNHIFGKPSTYPPSSHASTHALGGSDAISLDASQISSGRISLARMPTGTSGHFLRAQGPNADPAYSALTPSDIPNLDASKITSGRFPMSRLPDGTEGYVLTAQGAGQDPAWAPPPAPAMLQPFLEITVPSHSQFVDITGLDLNAHKSYLIQLSVRNANTTAPGHYRIYFQGDYNDANYEAATTSGHFASSFLASVEPGGWFQLNVWVTRHILGWPAYLFHGLMRADDNTRLLVGAGRRLIAITNVTTIRIRADMTDGIAAGSTIRVFRVGG